MAVARASRPRLAPVRRQPAEGDRHLRVVPPDAARRSRLPRLSVRAGVVLTVSLFVALFGVAVSHTVLIEGQVQLDQLDERVAAEQVRYEQLRRDVAELESPERIVAEARDRLGMVEASDLVWLTPDRPAPATDGGDASEQGRETPDTSWADVKPFMEPTR